MDFAEEVAKEVDQYNGFNLILTDLYSKTMVYVTNRAKEDNKFVTEVSTGIHVLTNASLDSPWPKVRKYVILLRLHYIFAILTIFKSHIFLFMNTKREISNLHTQKLHILYDLIATSFPLK